jgi:hypothetical protein
MGDVFPCTEQGIRDAIAEGGGPHTFDCDGPQTVVTDAEIVIDNDVILDGEGNLTVDGDHGHRVFSVPEGVMAELRWLTVTRGYVSGGGVTDGGGGVASEGTLTIRGCVISNNAAGGPVGAPGIGGGILNARQMTIIDTTVTWNSVTHGTGGGIYNSGSATLTLVNSTVSNNDGAFDGSGAVGGGIHNVGELTIVNSTVSENSAHNYLSAGGGIYSSGRMSLINSTVSGNSADSAGAIVASDAEIANTLIDGDCEIDSTVSHEYNIESPGNTCGFDQLTDQVNVSADNLNLAELADNGGPTMTHALLPGSVAIDVIPEAACEVDTDQRGFPRDSMCDVGAFEVQP